MKYLILLIGICICSVLKSQALMGADLAIIAEIKSDGTVLDESGKKIGAIKSDGMVTNASSIIIGYIKSGNSIENEKKEFIGSINDKGEVINKEKKPIGIIKNGLVTTEKNETIGYYENVDSVWVAVYFFFLF
ncbi:MAG: hypothetical protein IPM51_09540 [Sphingobacteriaceae bacterium]|nr:hypothetical protein [Sphingobacteriaceae bacterium]